jgi:hypothetical protein
MWARVFGGSLRGKNSQKDYLEWAAADMDKSVIVQEREKARDRLDET